MREHPVRCETRAVEIGVELDPNAFEFSRCPTAARIPALRA
jgi:hypothetical protein